MSVIFDILYFANILLLFLLCLKINHNITFSIITAIILAILPWHILLVKMHSPYVLAITILLLIPIIFTKKIITYSRRISFFLISASVLIFAVSILSIPKDTNIEVNLQRTYASLTEFKFLSSTFSNKFIESYRTRESHLFQNLDFGNYFFSGHPRQRVGIKEIPKFYISLLPLAIIGLIKIAPKARWILVTFLVFSIILPIPFNDRTINSGALLILPMVILSAFGLYSLKRHRKIFFVFIIIELTFFLSSFLSGVYD